MTILNRFQAKRGHTQHREQSYWLVLQREIDGRASSIPFLMALWYGSFLCSFNLGSVWSVWLIEELWGEIIKPSTDSRLEWEAGLKKSLWSWEPS